MVGIARGNVAFIFCCFSFSCPGLVFPASLMLNRAFLRLKRNSVSACFSSLWLLVVSGAG